MKLSALMDGEVHELFPGEDFGFAEDRSVIDELEEADEDCLPFEQGDLVPISHVANGSFGETDESQWGLFAVAMARLCHIADGKREQYQHNRYTDDGTRVVGIRYTFQFTAAEGGWTGERF